MFGQIKGKLEIFQFPFYLAEKAGRKENAMQIRDGPEEKCRKKRDHERRTCTWKKRWMAGAMAFALCCTTLLQTGVSAVSAAEVGAICAQSETQIEVQTDAEKSEDELIEEAVADPELALTVTEGEAFDIQNDFTGLKLSDGDHVELKKAAMEDGTLFDYNHAGTYKCVYLVTPASGEAYLVARNITVTPREAETDGRTFQSRPDGQKRTSGSILKGNR